MVFTGAGMSAESGVPTFRDAQTGLWERYDPQELATLAAFRADPALVWGWYEARRHGVRRAEPNPGHRAVAAIAARRPETVVITQNVDDLHERGGVPAPVRLHGSLFAPRCSACARPAPIPEDATAPEDDAAPGTRRHPTTAWRPATRWHPAACRNHRTGASRHLPAPDAAPVRPGVVWFGGAAVGRARRGGRAASGCDLLLTVGTSALVHPAAEIPLGGGRLGAPGGAGEPGTDAAGRDLRGEPAQPGRRGAAGWSPAWPDAAAG
ncbi:Sir2 family NAD-dependent protein deacetylase [Micromonospora sp. BRA006-A]|nr:Sir2 family NAD-dependent protein deacetylase [Micromonospora sp. BRA006-A]